MYMNGVKVNKRNDLGWRHGNPEKDVDTSGRPVKLNDVSIVRIKDCYIYDKEGRNSYEPETAPSIPIGHGGTYYGYGLVDIVHSKSGIWLDEEFCHDFQQVTAYFVKFGKVYSGSIEKRIGIHTYRIIFGEKGYDESIAKESFKKLMKCKPQITEKIIEVAIRYNCYEWFKPYLNQFNETEKELYLGYRLKDLVKNE